MAVQDWIWTSYLVAVSADCKVILRFPYIIQISVENPDPKGLSTNKLSATVL
jgi:hypothetical protein